MSLMRNFILSRNAGRMRFCWPNSRPSQDNDCGHFGIFMKYIWHKLLLVTCNWFKAHVLPGGPLLFYINSMSECSQCFCVTYLLVRIFSIGLHMVYRNIVRFSYMYMSIQGIHNLCYTVSNKKVYTTISSVILYLKLTRKYHVLQLVLVIKY